MMKVRTLRIVAFGLDLRYPFRLFGIRIPRYCGNECALRLQPC